jgi:hypothetical protein
MNEGTRICVLLVTLLTSLFACTPEVTAPQGGAAINKVVPMKVVPLVVPDVWCPASSGAGQDSTAPRDKNRPRAQCDAPTDGKKQRERERNSVSGKLRAPKQSVDSPSTAWDSTKQHAK